jgi:hypothetical protein
VVHRDAADYNVQPDQNVFFMFNPFDHIVMQHVIEHIAHSLEEVPRPIWLIYLNVKNDCRRVLVENGVHEQIVGVLFVLWYEQAVPGPLNTVARTTPTMENYD